jgi:hypothetical protein|tara:strand:+ start:11262 stop:11588 length:327 start_codon:yes stop_codon:yes gene_type:complete
VVPDKNTIIKKLVYHRGVSTKEFATICEGHLSRSKASGIVLASNNRRHYKAKPGDVETVMYCLTGLRVPEAELLHKADELIRVLDSGEIDQAPGKEKLLTAIKVVFGL